MSSSGYQTTSFPISYEENAMAYIHIALDMRNIKISSLSYFFTKM